MEQIEHMERIYTRTYKKKMPGYEIDQDYPQQSKKRVSNTIGTIECDENGDKWLSHGKIIGKGGFEAAPEEPEEENE